MSPDREDSKRIEWLAEQLRRERKSYSRADVATGGKPWPEEWTTIVHTRDGKIAAVSGDSFRDMVDQGRRLIAEMEAEEAGA